jgi:PAS domain S-box-containing protein
MLPAMLAFVDTSTRYQYHNRSFRNWVGLRDDRVDGQHMRDVLGRTLFAEIEPYVLEAAAGRTVCYQRTQMKPDGRRFRLAVQLLPQAGSDGKPAGFHVVMTDITSDRDSVLSEALEAVPRAESEEASAAAWQKAGKGVLAAINGNEFTLFCQRIVADGGRAPDHHEVLIRLREEESGHVLPGAFFSLAEEHGLMPILDRWMFEHVLQWMVSPVGAQTVLAGEMYFINVDPATLSDPGFPDFVELHLRMTGAPGESVCIEIAEADLVQHEGDAVAFARNIRACGCKIAISGFGRNRLSLGILRLMQVDFLKIDGSIVRQVATYPLQLGKVAAITRIAKSIGVRTIAEMVEDSQTLGMLGDAGVDYAQGFGIARPRPLEDVVPLIAPPAESSMAAPHKPKRPRQVAAVL